MMLDSSPRLFSAQLNITADSFADGKTVSELRKTHRRANEHQADPQI